MRSGDDQPYRPLRIPPKISVECDLSNSAAFMVPHSRLNDLLDIQLPIRQEEFSPLLICHGANVDAVSKRAVHMLAHSMAMLAQCTPVHSAVCIRNEKAVRPLLSLGADLDVEVLSFAAKLGHSRGRTGTGGDTRST